MHQIRSSNALQSAKLLAYSSLCRPILEYADVLWDPADAASIEELEVVQNSNKICKEHQKATWHHGGPDSSWTTKTKGQKKVSQICTDVMTKILSSGFSSAYSYSEIVHGRNQISMTTRAAARGEPTSVYAKSHVYYYNSFLPKKNYQRSEKKNSTKKSDPTIIIIIIIVID